MFDALPGARPYDDHRRLPPGSAIAVVGSGIAGLSAAWLLSQRHRVTVFEAAARLGGHANTVEVEAGGRRIAVDTGFIVYNERTYPNLTRLFRHLGVATAASDMSFGVSVGGGRLEYAGDRRLAGLFAQRRNLLRPGFWRMLADIVRFYGACRELDSEAAGGATLGDLLAEGRYGRTFRDAHLLPMGAAIWSGTFRSILDMPAASFLAFCRNHGLLQIGGRPQWRTVAGRSRDYVNRLAAGISGPVHLNAPVRAIRRGPDGVELALAGGGRARFDRVVVAAHADAALRLLADPSEEERRLLGAFAFQPNRAILHADAGLMPRRRACWSSWNYLADKPGDDEAPVFVTYWLNRLQNLGAAPPLFLSLNAARRPREESVLAEFAYDHPQFDGAAIAAQAALPRIQGARNTWFCGAWTRYGFHEDGLVSGMTAASALGAEAPWLAPAPAAAAEAPAPSLASLPAAA
ncbi:MAG: FAD-dependent oxidoreductase [Candidatus Odyssella sp.]|nr:FAD-dependent oxidoreductase [Candidatus Odyssella sp.]